MPGELLWRGERLQAALRLRTRISGEAGEFIDASAAAESHGRRVRRGTLGVGAVLVGAAVVLLFSFVGASEARRRAEDARQRAEDERGAAIDARRTAEAAAADNQRLRDAADRDREAALRDRGKAEELRKGAELQATQAAEALSKAEADRLLAEDEKKKAMELRRQAENDLQTAQAGQRLCQQKLDKKDQEFGRERSLLLDKIERCERALNHP